MRIFFAILIAVLPLVALGQIPFSLQGSSTLRNGLAGYWRLEEASGTRYDYSKYGNHLTPVNTPGNTAGKVGNGASLASASSQQLTISSNASMNFSSTDFTIACWSKANTLGGLNHGIAGRYNNTANKREYLLSIGTGNTYTLSVSGNGTSATSVTHVSQIVTNAWNFVVVWREVNSIYLQLNNGGTIYSNSFAGTVFSSDASFVVGAFGANNLYWDGVIDELGIWRRALNADERRTLWNVGSGTHYPWTSSGVFNIDNFSMDEGFSWVVVPDTQHCLAELVPMRRWVTDNQSRCNIQAVLGLGDIVNTANAGSFDLSTNFWYAMPSALPVLPIPGNHDYATLATRDLTLYNSYYGHAYYTNKVWWPSGADAGFMGSGSENLYFRKTIGGTPFLFAGLEISPEDATLNWFSNVCAAFPSDKVVVLTHSFIRPSGLLQGLDPADNPWDVMAGIGTSNNGTNTWQKCFRFIPNLVLVMNGHEPETGNAAQPERYSYTANDSHQVFASMADYQIWPVQGYGWLRLMQYRPSQSRFYAVTFRPHTGEMLRRDPDWFSFPF